MRPACTTASFGSKVIIRRVAKFALRLAHSFMFWFQIGWPLEDAFGLRLAPNIHRSVPLMSRSLALLIL
jgi:hypothetical protein